MSDLYQGIYLFYPAQQAIGYAYYDGEAWSGGININIVGHNNSTVLPIEGGIAAIKHNGAIYVFSTNTEKNVDVSVFYGGTDTSLHYIGVIPNLGTMDQVAVVEQDGNVCVYYKDASGTNYGGPASIVVQLSGQSLSVVAGPEGIVVDGQPTGWGPAVVYRSGAPNIFYRDSSTRLRGKFRSGPGSWPDISPSGAWLSYWPAAILVGGDIFVLYHGSQNRALYVDVFDTNTVWTQSVANGGNDSSQEMIVGGGPGACVYGGRVFCFTQLAGNQLGCQIYMGGQWLPNSIVVTNGSGNSLVNDLWYGPAAVAV